MASVPRVHLLLKWVPNTDSVPEMCNSMESHRCVCSTLPRTLAERSPTWKGVVWKYGSDMRVSPLQGSS